MKLFHFSSNVHMFPKKYGNRCISDGLQKKTGFQTMHHNYKVSLWYQTKMSYVNPIVATLGTCLFIQIKTFLLMKKLCKIWNGIICKNNNIKMKYFPLPPGPLQPTYTPNHPNHTIGVHSGDL